MKDINNNHRRLFNFVREAAWNLPINVKEAARIRSELNEDVLAAGARARELVEQGHRVNTRATLIRWISVGVFSALLLFGAGAWVGAYCL